MYANRRAGRCPADRAGHNSAGGREGDVQYEEGGQLPLSDCDEIAAFPMD